MFADKTTCMREAAATLGFATDQPGLSADQNRDAPNSNTISIRVAISMDEASARARLQRQTMRGSTVGTSSARAVAEVADISELVKYHVFELGGPEPPLECQLCDTALGFQFREIAQGHVGYLLI